MIPPIFSDCPKKMLKFQHFSPWKSGAMHSLNMAILALNITTWQGWPRIAFIFKFSYWQKTAIVLWGYHTPILPAFYYWQKTAIMLYRASLAIDKISVICYIWQRILYWQNILIMIYTATHAIDARNFHIDNARHRCPQFYYWQFTAIVLYYT